MMTGHGDPLRYVPGLAELASAQQGVCSRGQLATLGITSKHIDRHVNAGRWRTLGPIVVVVHCGPLDEAARRWAAVMNAGPEAALCAWTSLAEWGLTGWERSVVHVVVQRGRRVVRLAGVYVHESRRHTVEDIRIRRGLPVHDKPRSAIDAATWSSGPRPACGVLAAVAQQGLSTADRMSLALEAAGPVRYHRLLRVALGDIAGGAQALSEIDFMRFCRRHGLPRPTRQAVRRDSNGRRRYLDIEWELPSGRRVCVEIDGIGHMDVQRWYDDLLRSAELRAVDGTSVLPLPAMAYRIEPDRVARLLRQLLAA